MAIASFGLGKTSLSLEQDAHIVVYLRVFLTNIECTSVAGFGLGKPLQLLKQIAQIVVCRVDRMEGEAHGGSKLRLQQSAPGYGAGRLKIVMCFRVVGTDRKDTLIESQYGFYGRNIYWFYLRSGLQKFTSCFVCPTKMPGCRFIPFCNQKDEQQRRNQRTLRVIATWYWSFSSTSNY